MPAEPRPIIFDTDPGVDDAMALLLALASPELEVAGVTTVYGNHEVAQTTRNALYVLETAGRADVPVVAGAEAPLARPYRGTRSAIHGADGLGGAAEPPRGAPRDEPGGAAGFIARMVMARPGEITLVAVGPLTNLALALEREPRLPHAVREVVVMGGAVFCPGNITPVAEANIHHDPEAARRVLAAGWRLTLVGLDVTLKTKMDAAYLAHYARAQSAAGRLVGRIYPAYLQSYRDRYGYDAIPTHDPSAVAFAIDPSLFETRRLPLYVETEGRCAGQVVADVHGQWGPLPDADVCVNVDSPRLLRLFRERVS